MDAIQALITFGIFEFVFMVIASPVLIALSVLARFVAPGSPMAMVVLVGVLATLGSTLLAAKRAAAHHLSGAGFVDSIGLALGELRLAFEQLPLVRTVIGRFRRRKDEGVER
jgi:hypothetical protein